MNVTFELHGGDWDANVAMSLPDDQALSLKAGDLYQIEHKGLTYAGAITYVRKPFVPGAEEGSRYISQLIVSGTITSQTA